MSIHTSTLYTSELPNDDLFPLDEYESEENKIKTYPYNPCKLKYNEPFTLILTRSPENYTSKLAFLIKGIKFIDIKLSNSFCVLLDQFGKVYVKCCSHENNLSKFFCEESNENDGKKNDSEMNKKENEIKLLKFTMEEPIEKIFAKFSSVFVLLSKKGNVYLFGSENDSRYYNYLDENNKIKDELLNGEKIVEVACGDSHILLLSESGKLFGFGDNYYGQLGVTDDANYGDTYFMLSEINHISSKIVKVYATYNTSFALTENGELYGCGSKDYAASGLPIDDTNVRSRFSRIGIKEKVVEVYNGYFFVAVKTIDSKFYVFGYNNFNQFGESQNYTNVQIYGPHLLDTFNNNEIEELECGGYGSIIVTKSRRVFTSGDFGQAFIDKKNNFTEIDLKTHLGNHQVFSNNQHFKLNVRAGCNFVVFFAKTSKTINDIFNFKYIWKIADISFVCNQ
ncbi:hypothetical protein ABK040_005506 [Willaertia magna]